MVVYINIDLYCGAKIKVCWGTNKKSKQKIHFYLIYFNFFVTLQLKSCGCSVVAARKTSDLDSAYLQCAGAGSIPVTRSTVIEELKNRIMRA